MLSSSCCCCCECWQQWVAKYVINDTLAVCADVGRETDQYGSKSSCTEREETRAVAEVDADELWTCSVKHGELTGRDLWPRRVDLPTDLPSSMAIKRASLIGQWSPSSPSHSVLTYPLYTTAAKSKFHFRSWPLYRCLGVKSPPCGNEQICFTAAWIRQTCRLSFLHDLLSMNSTERIQLMTETVRCLPRSF